MQKKIYSLMYVCVLDNLNSIGQNGWQATTRLLREYLFNVYFLARRKLLVRFVLA